MEEEKNGKFTYPEDFGEFGAFFKNEYGDGDLYCNVHIETKDKNWSYIGKHTGEIPDLEELGNNYGGGRFKVTVFFFDESGSKRQTTRKVFVHERYSSKKNEEILPATLMQNSLNGSGSADMYKMMFEMQKQHMDELKAMIRDQSPKQPIDYVGLATALAPIGVAMMKGSGGQNVGEIINLMQEQNRNSVELFRSAMETANEYQEETTTTISGDTAPSLMDKEAWMALADKVIEAAPKLLNPITAGVAKKRIQNAPERKELLPYPERINYVKNGIISKVGEAKANQIFEKAGLNNGGVSDAIPANQDSNIIHGDFSNSAPVRRKPKLLSRNKNRG